MADVPVSGGKDVKLPGLGKVDKKYAIGGALAAVAIVVVVMVRKKSAASAAAAATPATGGAATVTDPAGNVCSVLDPNSGYCPGSSQDQAYQQNESGALSNLGDESDYGGTGSSAVSGDYDAAGYPIGSEADLQYEQGLTGTGTSATTSTSGITTNSSWLTEAVDELMAQGGDSATIQTALSMVLGGLAVTSAQQSLFLEAVGILGQPPQGYPQPIKLTNTAATSTGTTAGTGTAQSTPKAPYVGVSSVSANSVKLSVTGGFNSYKVAYSANYGHWNMTSPTGNITIGELRSKTVFTFSVTGIYKGVSSPPTTVNATTK